MNRKRYVGAALLCATLPVGHGAQAQEGTCGEVSIASMNWPSAELTAEIDNLILSEGYGCDTELVAGQLLPLFASMTAQSEPDLAPELWVNAVSDPLNDAIKLGELIVTAEILSDGALEGWWVPKYIVDANPGIVSVEDALARPELFPAPEGAARGAIHNCPSGWGCQIIGDNLFEAYEAADKGFELVDPGSAAGLDDSLMQAYEREEGWLGYYWAPTAILGSYEMVQLEMPENDRRHWDSCTVLDDCSDPEPNGWPRSEVYSVVTDDFTDKAGVAMDYVSRRQWDNDTVSELLAWMTDNEATGAEAAVHFLENHEDVWREWVSEEVADKVRAAL